MESEMKKREKEPEPGRAVRLRIVFPPTIDLFVNRAAPPPDAAFLSLSLFLFLSFFRTLPFVSSRIEDTLSRCSSSCRTFAASRTFPNRTWADVKKDLSHPNGGVTVTSPGRTSHAYGSSGTASSQG